MSSTQVFSTYVEVILDGLINLSKLKGFLHVCGGDPALEKAKSYQEKFSPRMWR